jgi:hypothetical protein
MVTLSGHGRHEHHGEESQEIEQLLPILGLPIHEQISVHEILPHFTSFVARSTMVTLWAHMVVTTTTGRRPKESEQLLPILALLAHEHITVHEVGPLLHALVVTSFEDI